MANQQIETKTVPLNFTPSLHMTHWVVWTWYTLMILLLQWAQFLPQAFTLSLSSQTVSGTNNSHDAWPLNQMSDGRGGNQKWIGSSSEPWRQIMRASRGLDMRRRWKLPCTEPHRSVHLSCIWRQTLPSPGFSIIYATGTVIQETWLVKNEFQCSLMIPRPELHMLYWLLRQLLQQQGS